MMDIVDLANTLGCRRYHLCGHGYVVAKRGTLLDDLNMNRLRTLPNVKSERNSPSDLASVFTGQGAQWVDMAKERSNQFSVYLDPFVTWMLFRRACRIRPTGRSRVSLSNLQRLAGYSHVLKFNDKPSMDH